MEPVIGKLSGLPIPYQVKTDIKKNDIIEINSKKYKIIGSIGEGGFGTVYQAIYLPNNKSVALKLIPIKAVKNSQLFIRELKVMKVLSYQPECNEYIVCLYDNGKTVYQGHNYYAIVMEFLPKSDDILNYSAKAWGTEIPPNTMIHILKQLVFGLKYIHSKNVYHLDIKPENILVYPNKNRLKEEKWWKFPKVKYIDLGLSCIKGTQDCHQLRGTYIYSSPEIVRRRVKKSPNKITNKELKGADIYALGTVLYDILGQHPNTQKVLEIDEDKAIKYMHDYKKPETLIYPEITKLSDNEKKLGITLGIVISSLVVKNLDNRINNFDKIIDWLNKIN